MGSISMHHWRNWKPGKWQYSKTVVFKVGAAASRRGHQGPPGGVGENWKEETKCKDISNYIFIIIIIEYHLVYRLAATSPSISPRPPPDKSSVCNIPCFYFWRWMYQEQTNTAWGGIFFFFLLFFWSCFVFELEKQLGMVYEAAGERLVLQGTRTPVTVKKLWAWASTFWTLKKPAPPFGDRLKLAAVAPSDASRTEQCRTRWGINVRGGQQLTEKK